MAAALALLSAVLFALARMGKAVQGIAGLFQLIALPAWLLGTLVLLTGYGTQGAALDRGKLVVVQPLLVTTIVWALPLGYLLTNQHVVPRQILGAAVVVVGLALFVLVGDPDAGVNDASTRSFVIAIAVIGVGRRPRRCARPSSEPPPACCSGCRRRSTSRSSTTCT